MSAITELSRDEAKKLKSGKQRTGLFNESQLSDLSTNATLGEDQNNAAVKETIIFDPCTGRATSGSLEVRCCVPDCNRSQKDGRMFLFPIFDAARYKAWLIAIRRASNPPEYKAKVCSAHFISGKPSTDARHPDWKPHFRKPANGKERLARYNRQKLLSKKSSSVQKIGVAIKSSSVANRPLSLKKKVLSKPSVQELFILLGSTPYDPAVEHRYCQPGSYQRALLDEEPNLKRFRPPRWSVSFEQTDEDCKADKIEDISPLPQPLPSYPILPKLNKTLKISSSPLSPKSSPPRPSTPSKTRSPKRSAVVSPLRSSFSDDALVETVLASTPPTAHVVPVARTLAVSELPDADTVPDVRLSQRKVGRVRPIKRTMWTTKKRKVGKQLSFLEDAPESEEPVIEIKIEPGELPIVKHQSPPRTRRASVAVSSECKHDKSVKATRLSVADMSVISAPKTRSSSSFTQRSAKIMANVAMTYGSGISRSPRRSVTSTTNKTNAMSTTAKQAKKLLKNAAKIDVAKTKSKNKSDVSNLEAKKGDTRTKPAAIDSVKTSSSKRALNSAGKSTTKTVSSNKKVSKTEVENALVLAVPKFSPGRDTRMARISSLPQHERPGPRSCKVQKVIPNFTGTPPMIVTLRNNSYVAKSPCGGRICEQLIEMLENENINLRKRLAKYENVRIQL